MKKRLKSTKVVKDMRIKEVIKLMTDGKYRWEIIEELSTKWECSERNVIRYIEVVTKLLKLHFTEQDKHDILSKYNQLYVECKLNKDYKTANMVLNSIVKIQGFEQPNKIDITSNGESIGSILEKTFGFNDKDRPEI